MDRDDAGTSDRSDEARQGDTGMIGSESEEPGPGRDTSLTEPDPVSASSEEPKTTVAMSEGDPMATRLGSHVEGAGVIGYDVAAAEEGATQTTPTEDRPGYEAERPVGDAPTATAPVAATAPLADERDSGLAAEPVVDPGGYDRVEDAGPTDSAGYADDPARFGTGDAMAAPATYTGEEADVTGRPGYADRSESGDQEGVYDQEADQARRQRPSDGG